jgi:threonylcarbamoyladenosine tRNA methylthiotransferase MtaB
MLASNTSESGPSVAFFTLGCKTNQLETSAIAQQFRQAGWQVVGFEDAASLYVINSCTVTERADRDTQRTIRKARLNNPHAKIAVTGCYAQVAPVEVSELPGVDYVLGNAEKANVAEIIGQYPDLTQPLVKVSELDKSRVMAAGQEGGLDRTRASLKIQDGCDYKCTYCIIWEARGPSRCLPVADLQAQVRQLVDENGFKEIVLTGINIGQYLDATFTTEATTSPNRPADLSDLLLALVPLCEGKARLRLSSLDPLEVDERLIAVMAQHSQTICPHVHLSAQSATDKVLKLMARRHHVADFTRICHQLKAAIPGVCIGSDIIVGFPGETEADYLQTRQVLEETPIDYFHVFAYSRRKGTPAATMRPQVPQRVIQWRSGDLSALSAAKFLAYRQGVMGKHLTVIVEHMSDTPDTDTPHAGKRVQKGMSAEYLRVSFTPATPPLPQNSLVSVNVTAIEGTVTWVTLV